MAGLAFGARGGRRAQSSRSPRAKVDAAAWVAGLLTGLAVPSAAFASTPAAERPPAEAPATAAAPIELDGAPLEGRTAARRVQPSDADVRLNGLVLVHFGDGLGAGGQLRIGGLGLRATLGYEPLLFIVDDDPQDTTLGDFKLAHSAQLNLDGLLLTRSEVGASVGYRYSTVLGHGVAVAFQSMFDLWRQRFAFSIPVMYFPAGTARVRDRYDLSADHEINFPFGAGIQYGIGVAWLL